MHRATMYILIGASLWGTIGFFVKNLYTFGFTPMEVVTIRVVTAAIILIIYLQIKSPKTLKLQKMSDIKYFIGTGIFSIIFFNYCLFKTMELASIPMSAVLLYTAPAFVIILSYFLFKEQFTKNKLIALLLTFMGIIFVVGLIPYEANQVAFMTIIVGLGSGLGYALYSIFSKFALKKYSGLSITAFTFIIAAISLLPFFPYQEKAHLLLDPKVLFFAFGLGFIPTVIAYIIYTSGLFYTEASKAAILSTIEPIVATIVGILIFGDPFDRYQMIGMMLIIAAVIFVQRDTKRSVLVKEAS